MRKPSLPAKDERRDVDGSVQYGSYALAAVRPFLAAYGDVARLGVEERLFGVRKPPSLENLPDRLPESICDRSVDPHEHLVLGPLGRLFLDLSAFYDERVPAGE